MLRTPLTLAIRTEARHALPSQRRATASAALFHDATPTSTSFSKPRPTSALTPPPPPPPSPLPVKGNRAATKRPTKSAASSASRHPSALHQAAKPSNHKSVLTKPPKRRRPTLEYITLVLARLQKSRPGQSVQDVVANYKRWSKPVYSQLPELHEDLDLLLRAKLDEHRLSEADWFRMLQALCAHSWPQVRSIMYAFPDTEWPSFVLNYALRLISTLSEASDGLAVVVNRIATAKPMRLAGFTIILAEKILYEFPALHLATSLTDLFFQVAQKFSPGSPGLTSLCVRLAKHLALHDNEMARANALRLLDWAARTDAKLYEQVLLVLFRVDRSPPEFYGNDSSNASKNAAKKRAPAYNATRFLTAELAERLLLLLEEGPRLDASVWRQALRSAILTAGRDGEFSKARAWFQGLTRLASDVGEERLDRAMTDGGGVSLADLEIYLRAMSQAEHGDHEAVEIFNELQDSIELDAAGHLDPDGTRAWETMLGFVSKDSSVSLDRMLAMLVIRLQDGAAQDEDAYARHRTARRDDETDALVQAAMPLANQLCRTPRTYTIVMHGLVMRQEPRAAVAVWNVMLQRQVRPSRASLSVLMQALFVLGEARQAIEQMRRWCEAGVAMPYKFAPIREPFDVSLAPTVEAHLEVPKWQGLSGYAMVHHRIAPDAMLASVVFEGLYRTHASDTVLSIWETMKETLGVAPDAPIVAILIKCACGNGVLARLGCEATFSPYLAKSIFRKILLLQHPELASCEIRSLLGLGGGGGHEGQPGRGAGEGWLLRSEIGMRTVERWMGDRVSRLVGKGWRREAVVPYTSQGRGSGGGEKLDFVVTFTAELFDHYLRLLLYIQLHPPTGFFRFGGGDGDGGAAQTYGDETSGNVEEMLLLLAWMRQLDVRPLRRTVASICLELEEALPPLSFSSSASSSSDGGRGDAVSAPSKMDEATKPLRENASVIAEWLYEWRGESMWPSDRDMQVAWKWKRQRQVAVEEAGEKGYEERRRWFRFSPEVEER
ncbi:hypothetical protein ACQY0O_000144 [Thecaphora frezii]